MTYTFELSFFSLIGASEVNDALLSSELKIKFYFYFPPYKLWSPFSLITQQKIT